MTIKREVFAVMGRTVLCDWCCEDFTDSEEQGGFTFGSKATCPRCAPKIEADAEKFSESHMIAHRCPDGMSFADWVRNELRGGDDGECVMVTADSADELFKAMFGGSTKGQ